MKTGQQELFGTRKFDGRFRSSRQSPIANRQSQMAPGEGRRKMLADRLTDLDRRAFLDVLDHADFEVTDWEASFIESTIDQGNFSPGQREVIEKMICKYGERLGF